jgi:putative Ca2+/H+ antiporter (TMEM165/GDT1 family)
MISAAEFGDKTQISILVLASKTDKHLQLLIGVVLAFLIVDGIAIAAGTWITTIIPIFYLKIISGILFIIFGLLIILKKGDEGKKQTKHRNPFITAFLIIMLTEWGDKTQIAAALFATQYNPYLVLIGTLIALAGISIIAIYFGKYLSSKINRKTMDVVAGSVFILLGFSFLFV